MKKVYFFLCSDKSQQECFDRQLLGVRYSDYTKKYLGEIKSGNTVFLWNYSSQELYGPFLAVSDCGMQIEEDAWNGDFKLQVRFAPESAPNAQPQPESVHPHLRLRQKQVGKGTETIPGDARLEGNDAEELLKQTGYPIHDKP